MIYTENMGYQKPNIHQGVAMAKEMDMPVSFATNARRRYLMDELELLDLEIAFYDDYDHDDAINVFFALSQYSELTLKRAKIEQELRSIKTVARPQTDRITDADIDRARDYPVNQLIEFVRGTATAFCHNDKRPSMYHATRINKAHCPVCAKSFDSIAILMERDGMGFIDAVKSLTNR